MKRNLTRVFSILLSLLLLLGLLGGCGIVNTQDVANIAGEVLGEVMEDVDLSEIAGDVLGDVDLSGIAGDVLGSLDTSGIEESISDALGGNGIGDILSGLEGDFEAVPEDEGSTAGDGTDAPSDPPKTDDEPAPVLAEDGVYDSKEDVSLYLYLYGKLPSNFMTKKEARDLGWSGGSVENYAPGMCIGGDRFGNYEELLPVKDGRQYYECDIDTIGASSRGAKRIVFSNDGLIYYTDDHYESFTLLYGEAD